MALKPIRHEGREVMVCVRLKIFGRSIALRLSDAFVWQQLDAAPLKSMLVDSCARHHGALKAMSLVPPSRGPWLSPYTAPYRLFLGDKVRPVSWAVAERWWVDFSSTVC